MGLWESYALSRTLGTHATHDTQIYVLDSSSAGDRTIEPSVIWTTDSSVVLPLYFTSFVGLLLMLRLCLNI